MITDGNEQTAPKSTDEVKPLFAKSFPGVNPNAPSLNFYKPIGRSVYNGLQTKFSGNVQHPFTGARTLNLQLSYALSRFENSGGNVDSRPVSALASDQDFGVGSLDNVRPSHYFGPSILDRTHQLSFGGYADLPGAFQLGLVSHFWSPLLTSSVVPNTNLGPGEIFRTDFTGDGTVQDPIPGTRVGSFDRGSTPRRSTISSPNTIIAVRSCDLRFHKHQRDAAETLRGAKPAESFALQARQHANLA